MARKLKVETEEPKGEPSIVEAQQTALVRSADATKTLELIKRVEINTDAQLAFAVRAAADVKVAAAEVESKRKSFTEPLERVVKDLRAFFKPAADALDSAESVLKTKIAGYHDRRLIERDNLLRDAGNAGAGGDAARAESLVAAADAAIVPKVEGMSVRTTWDGEIVDATLLPREYLMPDLAALKARTRSMKGDPGIPGWRAFPSSSVAITVDKVE